MLYINENQIKAVVFDLDGTLIDSIPVWKQVDQQYLDSIQQVFTSEVGEKIKAQSFEATAQYFIDTFQLDKSVDEILKEWFALVEHAYSSSIPLKAGARTFIEYLHKKQIKMVIASSCDHRLIDAALQFHELKDYFEFVVTSSDLQTSKSEPTIYLHCAQQLGLHPSQMLVIEDIAIAMRSANKAHFNVVAMYDEDAQSDHEHIVRYAHHYIKDFRELLEETHDCIC
ncbi:MAG: HAD family hydrolase [Erysipelotrichaceae bacterium]